METLLRAVTEKYELVDISTQDADLEEVFLTYYHDDVTNGRDGSDQSRAGDRSS